MGKVLPFSSAATPEEEAQQWIVRIDRARLSVDERTQLRDWLARDPRHGKLLDEHARIWHAAGKAHAAASPLATPAARPAWVRRGAGFGAMAAGVAALVFWFGPVRDSSPVLQTATGQHHRFAMNDGSHIELNTQSRAIVHFAPSHREIVLVDGEGYFEVAHDRNRPFTVVAGSTTVRAVGTRFSVQRRADGQVDVIVSEGVVQVTQRARQDDAVPVLQTRLVAGETLAATSAKLAVAQVSREKIARLMAWQQGRIDFDDTPLAAALAEMNRYAATPMRAGDAAAASVKVSGSFSTGNVDAFLRSLELGFDLQVVKGDDGYVIRSRRRS